VYIKELAVSSETRKAYMEKFRQEHKEEHLRANKLWSKENKNKVNRWARLRHQKIRREVLVLLGNKCTRCGFDNWKALQIDHINGGGRQDIESFSSNVAYLSAVKASVEKQENKYQLLCANCNQIKRYEDC